VKHSVRWGILGTGWIAGIFAQGISQSQNGVLAAVASRTQAAADRFGDTFGVPLRLGSYRDLLRSPSIDAVYIATPHTLHAEWTIEAARHGKHVLCEKPLAINHAQAAEVFAAAERHGVFVMEAFMYRCHPQTTVLADLIRAGNIGKVYAIEAAFSFEAPYDPGHRLFAKALGGGAILDVGCYCISMARLLAGAASGLPVAEPISLQAVAKIGPTSKVDEYASALLEFPGGIVATLSAGIVLQRESAVRVYGSAGTLKVPSPWWPDQSGDASQPTITRAGQADEPITISCERDQFAIEAETFVRCLSDRSVAAVMSREDSLNNMKALDWWRRAVGCTYEEDTVVWPR
jgi:predicted dehydrogenase